MSDDKPWAPVFPDLEPVARWLLKLSDEFKFLEVAMPGVIEGTFRDFRNPLHSVRANILAAKAAIDEALRVLSQGRSKEESAREVMCSSSFQHHVEELVKAALKKQTAGPVQR